MDIKKALIEEIKMSCESKLKDEVKRLKSQEDKLNHYKQNFLNQIEKIKSNLSKNEENKNTMTLLKDELDSNLLSKRNFIENLGGRNLNKENCFNFVEVKNPEDNFIQLLSMEATIEDMYIIIKRGFEKGAINFNETMRFIRSLSKEAVKIKFMRDKISKKYDKNFNSSYSY